MGPQQLVVALDLSGHGNSDPRPSYTYRGWASELVAVVEQVACEPAVLVCHSMGGRVGTVAAGMYHGAVSGLVLVDAIIPTHDHEPMPLARPLQIYPDRATAVGRFRLRPGDASVDPSVLAELAEDSVRPVDGGWAWKFDPRAFAAREEELVNASIRSIACPVAVVQAELSAVTDLSLVDSLAALLGRSVEAVVVPGTDHHLMVDRPHEMAGVLQDLTLTRAERAPG
jgi:pimeloyl-ACP methyl ester carboxylesterase